MSNNSTNPEEINQKDSEPIKFNNLSEFEFLETIGVGNY